MRHLFAYLLVRRSDGSWDVGSHRGLETIVSTWKGVKDCCICGVVHVGFWRPDTVEFEKVASERPGSLLLTEPARWSLPDSFRASARPVGSAGGMLLYRALTGWGFDLEDDSGPATPERPTADHADANAPTGPLADPWLDWIRSNHPKLWRVAFEAGIVDEGTYLARERLLPDAFRDEIGRLRLQWFARGEISQSNILAHLTSAPPWLLNVEISRLPLSTRAGNRLASQHMTKIGDLASVSETDLMKIPSMGRRSVAEVAHRVFDAFRGGSSYCSGYGSYCPEVPAPSRVEPPVGDLPSGGAASDTASGPTLEGFFAELRAALAHCDHRTAKVLRLRMGLHGPMQTLDAVGKAFFVTRERVRQIEKKGIKTIATMCKPWIESIGRRTAAALAGRDEPLPLVGLEILDPWFTGVSENWGPLRFALEQFFDEQPFWLLKVDGQIFVSAIATDEWTEALRKARAQLEEVVRGDQSVNEKEARCLSDSMLPEDAASLRPLLWLHVTRWANFSTTPNGERQLASFGQGAENVVEAVLLESDRPLHYEEISRRCSARGRPVEVRRAHSAAASIGILLGRGVFGLERHFPLSEEEAANVLSEAENIVAENPTRQWHAEEIADALGDLGLDFSGRLTKYVVTHVLKGSKNLVYLGKFVWALRSGGVRGKADRIGIWQAVVAMLEESSGPMRTQDIRDRLSRDRGLGVPTLLITQGDPLIRVGEGEWGLLWRDIPFSEDEAADIVLEMEDICRARGEGLHVTEIVGALRSTAGLVARLNDPVLLVSLASRTGRMKAARGGYVHPSDWEGSRRLTASEAVAEALAEAGSSGGTLTDLATRAGALLGREIPTHVASRMLISAGADYDDEGGVWRVSEIEAGDGDEVAPEELSNPTAD